MSDVVNSLVIIGRAVGPRFLRDIPPRVLLKSAADLGADVPTMVNDLTTWAALEEESMSQSYVDEKFGRENADFLNRYAQDLLLEHAHQIGAITYA